MGSNTSSPLVTPTTPAANPQDTHLKVHSITKTHPIENREWTAIRMETTRNYLTIAELSTFLNRLLEEYPEFADTCVECVEDEFATSVSVGESGLTLH
jgi:hypothetical protein